MSALSLLAQDHFGDKREEWLLKAEQNTPKLVVREKCPPVISTCPNPELCIPKPFGTVVLFE
jgi:hypothetical protein